MEHDARRAARPAAVAAAEAVASEDLEAEAGGKGTSGPPARTLWRCGPTTRRVWPVRPFASAGRLEVIAASG
jgi:hypothetical protein